MVVPQRGTPTLRAHHYVVEGARRHETWMEVPIDGGWTAAYLLMPQEGRPVVAEVRVFPTESEAEAGRWSGDSTKVPSGGLPSSVARAIALKDALRGYPRVIKWMEEQHGPEAIERAFLSRHGFTKVAREAPSHPGRAGRPDDFYANLAQEYVALLDRRSSSPVKDLAERHSYKEGSVRDLIHEARRRDLLTPTTPGRAGGHLTEKAKGLLSKSKGRSTK